MGCWLEFERDRQVLLVWSQHLHVATWSGYRYAEPGGAFEDPEPKFPRLAGGDQ